MFHLFTMYFSVGSFSGLIGDFITIIFLRSNFLGFTVVEVEGGSIDCELDSTSIAVK